MGFMTRKTAAHREASGLRMGRALLCVLPFLAAAPAQAEPEPEPDLARLLGPLSFTLAGTEPAPRLPKVDLALLVPSPTLQPSRPLDPLQMLQQAQGARPESLSLALHWRPVPIAGHTLDISVWRRVTPVSSLTGALSRDPGYGAQVELQLATERMAALRDLLGVKLGNGARISLRRKSGRTTINFRMQF